MTHSLTLLSALLTASLFLGGCVSEPVANGDSSKHSAPKATTPVSTGEALFQANCATCHGMDGSGKSGMLKGYNVHFNDKTWQARHSDTQIEAAIREGRGMMPSFETVLTPQERTELIQYIRTLAQ